MKKILILVVVGIIVLIAAFYALNAYIYNEKQGDTTPVLSHKDATYVIDGKVIKLVNGVAETEAAPGSASKISTKYFGNEVRTDLNKDGREDVAFLVTQQTGGTGTFYYVVAALNYETGYEGSQGLLLGDRIAPQTTEVNEKGFVVVNYADRKANESFDVQPSVAKTLVLKLDTESMQFGEVVQNFEGEADPKKMSVTMKTWTWVNVGYNDGTTITPKKAGAFTLTIKPDGTFTATTDCNQLGGKVKAENSAIKFSEIYSTRMLCEGSQEEEFKKVLNRAAGYFFSSKGELVLDIERDSGSAIFK